MYDYKAIYRAQKTLFESGVTLPYAFRRAQLIQLKKAIKAHELAIFQALDSDLGKPAFEAFSAEIGLVYGQINELLQNLREWMRPVPVSSPFLQYPSESKRSYQPKGLTLLIGPWNYPFSLIMSPLASSIAAGNCCIVKPSEFAPATAQIIKSILEDTFSNSYIQVLLGPGDQIIPPIMEERFDHVFFTGSTAVGRKILEMAAPHLSSVTLELGGKSPCIVDESASLKVAAKRIVWGKFWNAGQTCIAPDYVLVQESVAARFQELVQHYIKEFYGSDAASSPDYARIINTKRLERLQYLLANQPHVLGGKVEVVTRYMEPTLVLQPTWESSIMREEIFGPILPILTYKEDAEILEAVRHNPYPLALYIFSKNRKRISYLQERIRFGGGCVNNVLVHFTNEELPFGGVGYSGMGRHGGWAGFQTFSNEVGIMRTGTWFDNPAKYPPYQHKVKWLQKLMR